MWLYAVAPVTPLSDKWLNVHALGAINSSVFEVERIVDNGYDKGDNNGNVKVLIIWMAQVIKM